MWSGNYWFVIRKLVLKDFKIRYRNMSLGVLWSLLNPIVMMSVLTFVFREIFKTTQPNYPVFVFCGLLPFNFFTMAWSSGTVSIVDNVGLVKRVPVPRDVLPIAAVLACCLHLAIQIALLLAMVLGFDLGVNVHWLWLPFLLLLEVVFVAGLSFFTAGINVFVRDTRYIVESINVLLFWLVPIIYPSTLVPQKFQGIFQLNPVTALVVGMRNVLIENANPAPTLLINMAIVSCLVFALGWVTFSVLKSRFYNYL